MVLATLFFSFIGIFKFIIGAIFFIVWIASIIHCIQSNLSTGKKVLWVLIIFFFPMVGTILYYFLGKTR